MSLPLPTNLSEQWLQRWDQFQQRASEADCLWLQQAVDKDRQFREELQRVWACSEFVASSCIARPEILKKLCEKDLLNTSYGEQGIQKELQIVLESVANEEELMRGLRQFRQQQMVRIVWRDFTRKAAMTETTSDMTYLAEAVLQAALDFLYPQACQNWGTPIGAVSGEPQQLVVLGMGKMGAYELNVSSDIDLIFTYPEAGHTEHKNQPDKKALSNQEFFIRLGQQLIKTLDVRNADGFVFRVDMRLRPYGQSGALVLNFDAMEEYYQTQGRPWERYAMIKARVVAGDHQAGIQLMALLRPFTYRKYIDFSAINALRDMKALINREVQQKGLSKNIKRGAGGIREVEFIGQAFQIIRGGRDVRFQEPSLLSTLNLLDSEGLLPEGKAAILAEGYTFLRNVEHAIQGWQDQQTQTLPADELGQKRLAFLLGFDDWAAFLDQLDQYRKQIRQVFEEVIAEQTEHTSEHKQDQDFACASVIWRGLQTGDSKELVEMGYSDPDRVIELLTALQQSRSTLAMETEARSRLDALIPRLLVNCGQTKNSAETLNRILPLIEAVVRRSAYLLLLIENPKALQSLVTLCAASPWIAKQLALYPVLLDELLDPRVLYSLPDQVDLEDELRQQVLRIPEDDLEALMETLRYFRRSHSLRVAACEIQGSLPLMKISDYLTWLAEAILKQVYRSAWEQMVARYGSPSGIDGKESEFLVVGYGKLGGIELSHSSDLDMVFIYDAAPNSTTDGDRSVDVATFFTRLGQRIIHLLTTQTSSGALYEADMRLRPSGNSGMLVTTIGAFEKYQQEKAWTWEHQALVRARPVAGSGALSARFEQARKRIICQPRNSETLKTDVLAMREKMRQHLGSPSSQNKGGDLFNLKHDRGGIVDIEFLTQYHVLLYGHEYPQLAEYTDNVRILEAMEKCSLLTPEIVQCLHDAYIFYRGMGHRMNLEGESNTLPLANVGQYREAITTIWQQVMESANA